MLQALEYIGLESKLPSFLWIGVDHLFERVDFLLITPISDEVDGAKTSLTKEIFYRVAVPMLSFNDGPDRERHLFLQHPTPHKLLIEIFITAPTNYNTIWK